MKICNKEELLMVKLTQFFNDENINLMIPIINGESNISLRIIDWFVTNYSKKIIHLIILIIMNNL